jgi:hypothetical protein
MRQVEKADVDRETSSTGTTHMRLPWRAARSWLGDGPVNEAYDNCFVMRFDSDGLCREFTEWFMKRPMP